MRPASSETRTASRATSIARPRSCTCCARASSATPRATALVEVGGAVAQLRRAVGARGARRRRPARRRASSRGDRVAIRLPNGIDWVLAFFGAQLLGAVVVPVNTRFTEDEVAYVVEDSGAAFTFVGRSARCPTASRSIVEDLAPGRSRGDLLHERHHRLPQGGDDLARATSSTNSENALPLPVRRALRRARTSRRSSRCRCSTSPAATAS